MIVMLTILLFLFIQSSCKVASGARSIVLLAILLLVVARIAIVGVVPVVPADLDGLPINKLVAAALFSLEGDVHVAGIDASHELLLHRLVLVPQKSVGVVGMVLQAVPVVMVVLGGMDDQGEGLLEIGEGLVYSMLRLGISSCLLPSMRLKSFV